MHVFEGISQEAFEFLVALRFNNNKPWFEQNKATFETKLKQPLYQLADELGDTIRQIDADMEIRPQRVVSRIYRDARRIKGGPPYRDYLWLGFRPHGIAKEESFIIYIDVSAFSMEIGAGFYSGDVERIRAFKQRILAAPTVFKNVVEDKGLQGFTWGGQEYKRPKIDPDAPEWLVPFLKKKSLHIFKHIPEEYYGSAQLISVLKEDILALGPLYKYVTDEGSR